jgi:hypothetical protein
MLSSIVLIDLMQIIHDNTTDMLYVSAETLQCDMAIPFALCITFEILFELNQKVPVSLNGPFLA